MSAARGLKSGCARTRSGELYKPSAIRSYEAASATTSSRSIGADAPGDLQRRDVQRIADDLLAEGGDPSTIRNALMPLRVVFRRALEDGDVAVNPCTHQGRPAVRGRRQRIASPEEAEQLLAALPGRHHRVGRPRSTRACVAANSWPDAGVTPTLRTA